MIADIGLLIVVGVLVATGAYLLMDRSILKMLLGLMLAGNGINLLILLAGSAPGRSPLVGGDSSVFGEIADPLAQGMILTAIVISMGLTAFGLGLLYRAYTTSHADEVEDDPEDTRLLRRPESEDPSRDRSSDPVTGEDTPEGDTFGPEGAGERP